MPATPRAFLLVCQCDRSVRVAQEHEVDRLQRHDDLVALVEQLYAGVDDASIGPGPRPSRVASGSVWTGCGSNSVASSIMRCSSAVTVSVNSWTAPGR